MSSKRSNQEQDAERVINQKNQVLVKQATDANESAMSWDFQLQSSQIPEPKIPSTIQNFEGLSSDQNLAAYGFRVMPPDTVGDVGPNHYVQATNLLVRMFDKNGNPLTAPFKMSSLFTPIGGVCAATDDGDPIVLYDPLADRWLLSQFAAVADPNTHQCIAISQSGDPTGTYFVYDYMMPNNKFNDYPHFGVWPDAYYMSDNQFNQAGTAFLGAGVFAFDRKKMLAGDPTASFIYFDLFTLNPDFGGQLPVDLDGLVAPPNGTPGLFVEFNADEFGAGNQDELRIFEFRPNFTNPGASTFTQLPDLPLAAFDPRNPTGRADIEQPPPATSGTFLDVIGDRLMHRLAYRNLGTVASPVHSYVLNFTVNVSGVSPNTPGTHQAGIRWTELRRNPGTGAMSVNQQATYAPGAADPINGRNIWMGSIAQDHQGNIGLGFSASSLTLFPSIIYTGRLATDPVNTLNQGEGTIITGTGSQRGPNRWGDYSAMAVDPADDCTFWYTQEYYTAASSAASTFGWLSRVGSFKFAECTPAPKGSFSGVITNCATALPVSGALVETTDPAGFIKFSNATGNYSVTAAPGTYDVRASKAGFGQGTGTVTVINGGNAILNICLQPTPVIVSGGATIVTESCSPSNGVVDPGERVTVNLTLMNNGTAGTANLVATLIQGGGVTAPSDSQGYGALAPTASAQRDFTFTAVGSCGGTITATWDLNDGPNNLGSVTKTFTLGTTVNSTQTFANATPILIPATGTSGPATPYPSMINVAGLTGTVSKVTVTLNNMNHTFPDDVDVLLVGPTGQKLLLMSDAGDSADLVNNTYTFDDAAAATLADGELNASGAYKPSNFGTGDTFPAPAPVGPYPDPHLLSVFNGVNPNGTWSLYVVDDVGGDVGNINLGWELNITTSAPSCTMPCGVVRLIVTSTLERTNATTVKATYIVKNIGTAQANNVQVTTARLGSTNGAPPAFIGNIPGDSQSPPFDVFFINSTTGVSSTLALGGTYTGGTFSSTRRVTIP